MAQRRSAVDADDYVQHDKHRFSAARSDHAQRVDELFMVILPSLYPRVLSYVGTPEEADEMIQEVYLRLRADRVEQTFVSHPNPIGYTLVTAANLIRDRWRSDQRSRALLARLAGEARTATDGGISEHESHVTIDAMLKRLNRKEAAAIVLVDLAGYPLSEAAALLGVKKATVHHNRARGLRRLRAFYRRRQERRIEETV
jgi:RNA polymerase sigma-70 factor, ECF subfamily